MADEQPQHPDLIDDAIRQAEQQLEQKLQALRMSALGDSPDAPAGEAPAAAGREEPAAAPAWEAAGEDWSDEEGDDRWRDAVMRPVDSSPEPAGGSWEARGFVPDAEPLGEVSPSQVRELPSRAWAAPAASAPTEEEVQFWAQTRTALRLLQQSTEDLERNITGNVSGNVEQILRDELSAPNSALRQIQQELPAVAERVERSLTEELEAPALSIRQLQEELPAQLERLERRIEAALQEDVARFEHSVADNVTRLAQGVTDDVGRVERGFRSEIERLEATVRNETARVGEGLREDIELPTHGIRQLQEDIPLQLQRIERVVREQDVTDLVQRVAAILGSLQDRQRELGDDLTLAVRDEIVPTRRAVRDLVDLDIGGVLGELVNAGRLTLDKLGSVSGDMDRGRLQQAEDVELVMDAMSRGWQGMGAAVSRVLDRVDSLDERLAGMEHRLQAIDRIQHGVASVQDRLAHLGDIEANVNRALGQIDHQLQAELSTIRSHIKELQPAPVMVTVNHPEAQVSQTTRGGYVPRVKEDTPETS